MGYPVNNNIFIIFNILVNIINIVKIFGWYKTIRPEFLAHITLKKAKVYNIMSGSLPQMIDRIMFIKKNLFNQFSIQSSSKNSCTNIGLL